MSDKKETRGGKRAGAGRKPMDLSEEQVKNILKDIKRFAKEHKSSIGIEIGKMIFKEPGRGFSYRDKLAAIKLYCDIMIIKRSHQSVEGEIHHRGPIILPAIELDHAKNEAERLELESERLVKEQEMKESRH